MNPETPDFIIFRAGPLHVVAELDPNLKTYSSVAAFFSHAAAHLYVSHRQSVFDLIQEVMG